MRSKKLRVLSSTFARAREGGWVTDEPLSPGKHVSSPKAAPIKSPHAAHRPCGSRGSETKPALLPGRVKAMVVRSVPCLRIDQLPMLVQLAVTAVPPQMHPAQRVGIRRLHRPSDAGGTATELYSIASPDDLGPLRLDLTSGTFLGDSNSAGGCYPRYAGRLSIKSCIVTQYE